MRDLKRLAFGYMRHLKLNRNDGTAKVQPDAPDTVYHMINAAFAEDSGPDKYIVGEVRSSLEYITMIGDELANISDEAAAREAIRAHGDLSDFTAWLNSRPDERGSYLEGILSRARAGRGEIPQTAYTLLREAKEEEMRFVFDQVLTYLKRRAEVLENAPA